MKTRNQDTTSNADANQNPILDNIDMQIRQAMEKSSLPPLPDTFTEQVLSKIGRQQRTSSRESWPLFLLMGLFPLGGYAYLKSSWNLQIGNELLGNPVLFATLTLIFLIVKLTDTVRLNPV